MGVSYGIITTTLSLLIILLLILAIIILIQSIRYGGFNILLPGLGLVVAGNLVTTILLILSVILIFIAESFRPQPEQTNPAQYRQNFPYPQDIYNGCGNGTLDLSLQKNSDEFNIKTDRHLKICINEEDLTAIRDIVVSGRAIYENLDQTELQKAVEHNKKLFEKFASEYPLLGRITNMYEDYVFTPEELPKLRKECLKLKSQNPNAAADLALRKFIFACDEATKDNFYLMFYGD